MTIHVVHPGETLDSISALYNIPVSRIILENGITNPDNLAAGQTIVIVQPELVYTVQNGDTLTDIADKNQITLMELLRNNPYLSERNYIYPGETLVIRYQTNKIRTMITTGFTFHYINRDILKKTLPFLTYLTIFNYRATIEGEIIFDEDSDIIEMAYEYGVAPVLFISTFTEQGISIKEAVYQILENPEVVDKLMNSLLNILKVKNFYAVNFYLESLNLENIELITDYFRRIADIIHSAGYKIFVTITPEISIEGLQITVEELDYSEIASAVDSIVITSYEWGRAYTYPNATTPINIIQSILDYTIQVIPPEKILLGLIPIGYDWTLPYVPGVSTANLVTTESAIQIAADNGIQIQFNEPSQAPYFYYNDIDHTLHIIWFKDARTFQAIAGLVPEYNLGGLSIWTIMLFNTQMWFIINTEYDIAKIPLT